ncbi:DNA ligase LigA-related protein [Cupriavidus metallidurans]|uniref:DNA ligase LigA-related protein n=1 Tax=Cupriavidus metallidurans TaxID=119219 RepID=UPI000492FEA7
MTSPEAHIKIEELRNELHRHNHNYYVLNAPEISDKEFDMLMKKLACLQVDSRGSPGTELEFAL